jgi:lactoylglutathione lyase
MVRIEHAALWTRDLEKLKDFYAAYFGGAPGERYANPRTGFSSYFLAFEGGARLEIMQMPGVAEVRGDVQAQHLGLAHIAFATGSREAVDALTGRLRADGFRVVSEPRTTGDGYYESCVLDPDGNRVEITA